MGVHSASRRGRGGVRRTPMAEINVTPLVDVMLVLLIIFMVTAPLMTAAVPVDLPDSRASAMSEEQEQFNVSVDRGGAIYVGEDLIPDGGFAAAAEGLGCSSADSPLVTLRADRALDYGRVVAVMGELNRAGCNRISLVTNGSDKAP
ncbi:protein TolR [Altererythrobacter xixiisoli]|uniref:Protein TolR n=2 Tax=Croceibacterium xixiisoli TaxID=1476466 RepID=A0A6I4TWI7_9SPHN|nr:protein TolR [Croceibacterium xixiisoli]